MAEVIIYHNPGCCTSRNTLALIREKGIEPRVIEYLKVGWTEAQLKDLAARTGGRLQDLLRVRGTQAEAQGLTDPSVPEAVLLKAMVADPVLVNRPIVATARGAALCRPMERVLDLI